VTSDPCNKNRSIDDVMTILGERTHTSVFIVRPGCLDAEKYPDVFGPFDTEEGQYLCIVPGLARGIYLQRV